MKNISSIENIRKSVMRLSAGLTAEEYKCGLYLIHKKFGLKVPKNGNFESGGWQGLKIPDNFLSRRWAQA